MYMTTPFKAAGAMFHIAAMGLDLQMQAWRFALGAMPGNTASDPLPVKPAAKSVGKRQSKRSQSPSKQRQLASQTKQEERLSNLPV